MNLKIWPPIGVSYFQGSREEPRFLRESSKYTWIEKEFDFKSNDTLWLFVAWKAAEKNVSNPHTMLLALGKTAKENLKIADTN